jgi:hypothetical protein
LTCIHPPTPSIMNRKIIIIEVKREEEIRQKKMNVLKWPVCWLAVCAKSETWKLAFCAHAAEGQ